MPRSLLLAVLFVTVPLLRAGDIALIPVAELWKYLKGTEEPPATWMAPDFEDLTWPESVAGFSTPGGYGEATLLADYGGAYQAIYFRKHFTVDDPSRVKELILRLDYDDGCVIYLNGREVARRGLPGSAGTPVTFHAAASPHLRGYVEEIDLSASADTLLTGDNVLAVQIVGSSPVDATFVFVPELLANFLRSPYVQNTTMSSVEVVWKTLTPTESFIEYGRTGELARRVAVGTNAIDHVAALVNLESDTVYRYRIGSRSPRGEAWSDWSSFRTFKPSGTFTFAVVGDTGWASEHQYKVAEQMRSSEVDLILHLGDLCYPSISRWNADQRLLSVYAPQMRTTPMFWVPGNHDAYTDFSVPFAIFHLPTNNVTGTEHYYSFDQGDAHFTVIWTDLYQGSRYEPGSPQYEWIERDLAATQKPWKFLFMHHCWRSSAIHQTDDYDSNGVRDSIQLEAVAELASRYGVQAFFNGHDHCYERFTPNRGIVNVLAGGGGAALYNFFAKHPDSVQFHSRYSFGKVTVTADIVTIQAIDESGRLFDSTHLSRNYPEKRVYSSSWHKPFLETVSSDDSDGNIAGQTFDFAGTPIAGKIGVHSSAGRLYVNNNATNLYLGLDDVMLHDGDEVLLFLEVPGLPGTTNFAQFGWDIALSNIHPAVVVILGDEFFDIPGSAAPGTRQGAMFLRDDLPAVAGQRLQQFNRSPQEGTALQEHAVNFAEIALPLAELGLDTADPIRAAAVVRLNAVGRPIDSGGIVTSNREPIEIRLATAAPRDTDGDGAGDEVERLAGTDPTNASSKLDLSARNGGDGQISLSWPAVPGKWYTLQSIGSGEPAFRDALDPAFPLRARASQETVRIFATNELRLFRIAVIQD